MRPVSLGWRGVLLALVLSTMPALLPAQERIEIGERARITTDSVSGAVTPAITGSILALRSDSIWVRPENRTSALALPLGSIRRLEVSMGRNGHARRWAWTGALVGGITLATIGYIDARACEPDPLGGFYSACTPESTEFVLGLLVGGAVGGGIGYLIGSRLSTERWRVVPLPRTEGASVQWRPVDSLSGRSSSVILRSERE